jgi:hypothetical protein
MQELAAHVNCKDASLALTKDLDHWLTLRELTRCFSAITIHRQSARRYWTAQPDSPKQLHKFGSGAAMTWIVRRVKAEAFAWE